MKLPMEVSLKMYVCMYSRAGASLTGPFEYLEIISASCLISNKAESSQKQK